jgi:hypothetical protein
LTFYYMTTSALVGIHAPEKEGFFASTIELVFSATFYFMWYERNNQVFHQIYQSDQDVSLLEI